MWLREIGPSDELRRGFCHDPKRWLEFREKYEAELRAKEELVQKIKEAEKKHGTVTLLYSAKDEEHNQAVALSNYLKRV